MRFQLCFTLVRICYLRFVPFPSSLTLLPLLCYKSFRIQYNTKASELEYKLCIIFIWSILCVRYHKMLAFFHRIPYIFHHHTNTFSSCIPMWQQYFLCYYIVSVVKMLQYVSSEQSITMLVTFPSTTTTMSKGREKKRKLVK